MTAEQEIRSSVLQELDRLQTLSVPITEDLIVYMLPSRLAAASPEVMRMIGLMRKQAFWEKGAGGAGELDLDEFDRHYHQMFVIKQGTRELVAGYRFFVHSRDESPALDMARLFCLDRLFADDQALPSVELGRSFVIPPYQKNGTVFFALFSGLGVIVNLFPETRYLLGKITFYPDNPHNGEVLAFLNRYHPDTAGLISPRSQHTIPSSIDFSGMSYRKALKLVARHMPEILKIYLKITEPRFAVVSGCSANPEFGEGIAETAFRISYPAVTDFWRRRFIRPTSRCCQGIRASWHAAAEGRI
jgi:hypothetical protein